MSYDDGGHAVLSAQAIDKLNSPGATPESAWLTVFPDEGVRRQANELILAAAAKIESTELSRGCLAWRGDKLPTDVTDPDATGYCMLGALFFAWPRNATTVVLAAAIAKLHVNVGRRAAWTNGKSLIEPTAAQVSDLAPSKEAAVEYMREVAAL